MDNQEDVAGRRARLRTLRERYEQPAHPATAVPVPPSMPGQRQAPRNPQGHRGSAPRQGGKGQGGGMLQKLARFLSETVPGDRPLPGLPVGEQRLRQALRLLEQRAQTAQGQAGERIQRLLRFLTQDIPGEPMVEGVNLHRLQQVLERSSNASPAANIALEAEIPPQPPVAHIEHAPPASAHSAPVTTATSEIAAIEEGLRQVQAMTEALQRRLDQIRQPSVPTPTVQTSPERRSPEAAIPPSSGNDDWFLEFLD